jgi:hypothetical protein
MLRLGMAIGLPVAFHVGYRVELLRFVLLQLSLVFECCSGRLGLLTFVFVFFYRLWASGELRSCTSGRVDLV